MRSRNRAHDDVRDEPTHIDCEEIPARLTDMLEGADGRSARRMCAVNPGKGQLRQVGDCPKCSRVRKWTWRVSRSETREVYRNGAEGTVELGGSIPVGRSETITLTVRPLPIGSTLRSVHLTTSMQRSMKRREESGEPYGQDKKSAEQQAPLMTTVSLQVVHVYRQDKVLGQISVAEGT